MNTPEKPELDDLSLDALFAEAKADAAAPDALLDRIVSDAAEVAKPEMITVQTQNVWVRMLDAVGGWRSLSGLATATVAGIYIGFSDPTVLETVGLSAVTEETSDLLFGDDVFFDDASIGEG